MAEKFPFWKKAAGKAGEAIDSLGALGEKALKKTNEELDKDVHITRRTLLKGVGASVVAGAVGGKILDSALREKGTAAVHESNELKITGENFLKRVEDYRKAYEELTAKEVQFIDDEGAPIGEPTPIAPYKGISPGDLDDNGILVGSLNQKWLDAVRADICAQNPNITCDLREGTPKLWNFARLIRDANERNPDIQAKTLKDIVLYNGSKTVVGDEEKLSRIQYLKEHANDYVKLSPTMAKELSSILPALAAQESQYDNESDSGVARGILQFRDSEWSSLGYTDADRPFLKKQTEAASRLLAGKLEYLEDHIGDELTFIEKRFFGTREEFEKYFLAPVLINSYNSGEGNLTKVVKWFCATFPDKGTLAKELGATDTNLGYDVYDTMAHMGRKRRAAPSYGRDSSQYVSRIMAWRAILDT